MTGKRKIITVNGKSVWRSRFVMEKALGRSLASNEHVHHINGNVEDDSIENLEVLDARVHLKLHSKDRSPNPQQPEHERMTIADRIELGLFRNDTK